MSRVAARADVIDVTPGKERSSLLHHASLSRTRSTVAACHLPPAGVATLRRFSSSAAFRADRPASSANSGRTCSARSRAACRSAMPFAFRPPSLTPRFLAAARPARDLLFFAMTPLRVVRRYRSLGASGEGPYRFAVRRTFAASRGSCLGRCLGRAHV
jgi:hypothetical protein